MEHELIVLNIRKLICEKGFLQKFIAEQSGFSQQEFSDLLNGRRVLKAEYIPRIAKALGVTPNDLYFGTRKIAKKGR